MKFFCLSLLLAERSGVEETFFNLEDATGSEFNVLFDILAIKICLIIVYGFVGAFNSNGSSSGIILAND